MFCCNLHFTPHAAFLELDLSLIIYHVVFRGMKHVIPKSFLEANPLATPLGSYFGNYFKTLSKITHLNITWIWFFLILFYLSTFATAPWITILMSYFGGFVILSIFTTLCLFFLSNVSGFWVGLGFFAIAELVKFTDMLYTILRKTNKLDLTTDASALKVFFLKSIYLHQNITVPYVYLDTHRWHTPKWNIL